MKDSAGKEIKIGDTVLVPEPQEEFGDLQQNGFQGHVDSFKGEYVTVMDGKGDCFDVEPNRLEIVED
jgi:hypothetical protein